MNEYVDNMEEIKNDNYFSHFEDDSFDDNDSVVDFNNFTFDPIDEDYDKFNEGVNVKLDFSNVENNLPKEIRIEEPKKEESKDEFTINDDKDVISKYSDDELDKMVNNDSDDFDQIFDSLYADVNNSNNFINEILEQKKNISTNEAALREEAEKLLKDKEDFNKYVSKEKEELEFERKKCVNYINTQKEKILDEEKQVKNRIEAERDNLKLKEETLRIDRQKFEADKVQFDNYVKIEQAKIDSDKDNLRLEKEQFEKDMELEKNRIAEESKNLEKSVAKFKELVTKFNAGFKNIPDEK